METHLSRISFLILRDFYRRKPTANIILNLNTRLLKATITAHIVQWAKINEEHYKMWNKKVNKGRQSRASK